ncbi:MAG: CoA transferase [Novosphingobium sp.]|nr:CoA transferase [Novosphingobium sp.]
MGPLSGVRVIEMSNIGPAPFCGMLLADLGAEVLRVDRLSRSDLGFSFDPRFDTLNRGKRAIAIDLKSDEGLATVKELASKADILVEGFRPGVMEKLGLGPDVLLTANPRLVYGRMTGWGQEGSFAAMAGHDINYLGMSGALASIGPKDAAPIPPLNLVGDFAGGSLYLVMGLLAAYIEAGQSGKGQVIDAAMVDGVASLMAMHTGFRQAGIWSLERGTNSVDGGAPYYTCYETLDGKYMAVGPVEQRFYKLMIGGLGLDLSELPDRDDPSQWDALKSILQSTFTTKTRSEWTQVFAGTDACVTPVYDLDEAPDSVLAQERNLFDRVEGIMTPSVAPRFSRTATARPGATVDPVADTHDALISWGIDATRVQDLETQGIVARSDSEA